MNKIILSFDYEIYFDGSNHLEALLENTNKILASARQNKSKLVFFIDIFYLIKLEENGLFLHCNKLKDQINNSTLELSYTNLINTTLTSSKNQFNSLLEEKEIDINIDYTDYSEFVHFSSAKERVDNFV